LSFVRSAWSVSWWTLTSRVLGLARDILTYHVLGAGWATGTFNLAWMVPNMLRRLLGEGALAAAFVPAFTRTLRQDGLVPARCLLASVTGTLTLLLGVVTALVVCASVVLPGEVFGLETADGVGTGERGALLWSLLAILFPYALPICLLAIYSGALHGFGVFALPSMAPVLLNVFWIAGLGIAMASGASVPDMTKLVAVAVLIGGIVQLVLVFLPLHRLGCLPSPRLGSNEPATRGVFRAMAPTILGLSMVQLNIVLDQVLAEYLVGPGANNHIYLANRLLLFPHALIALPLATTVFPRLAAEAAGGQTDAMGATLKRALGLTMFLALPASVGLIVIADDFVAILFQHGRYTAADARLTSWTSMALIAGLPALGASQLHARALYAIGETAAPARIAAWLVLLNLTLNLVLVLGLGIGVAGFTLATTLCTFVNAFALRRRLALTLPGMTPPWRPIGKAITATIGMAVACLAVRSCFAAEGRAAQAVLHLGLPILAGAIVYGTLQFVLGDPEMRTFVRVLRGRRVR
jgi:putative peptidoglycan lipid II flippase